MLDVSCSLCYHVHTNMSCKTLQWIVLISVLVALLSVGSTQRGQLYFVVYVLMIHVFALKCNRVSLYTSQRAFSFYLCVSRVITLAALLKGLKSALSAFRSHLVLCPSHAVPSLSQTVFLLYCLSIHQLRFLLYGVSRA